MLLQLRLLLLRLPMLSPLATTPATATPAITYAGDNANDAATTATTNTNATETPTTTATTPAATNNDTTVKTPTWPPTNVKKEKQTERNMGGHLRARGAPRSFRGPKRKRTWNLKWGALGAPRIGNPEIYTWPRGPSEGTFLFRGSSGQV